MDKYNFYIIVVISVVVVVSTNIIYRTHFVTYMYADYNAANQQTKLIVSDDQILVDEYAQKVRDEMLAQEQLLNQEFASSMDSMISYILIEDYLIEAQYLLDLAPLEGD